MRTNVVFPTNINNDVNELFFVKPSGLRRLYFRVMSYIQYTVNYQNSKYLTAFNPY